MLLFCGTCAIRSGLLYPNKGGLKIFNVRTDLSHAYEGDISINESLCTRQYRLERTEREKTSGAKLTVATLTELRAQCSNLKKMSKCWTPPPSPTPLSPHRLLLRKVA